MEKQYAVYRVYIEPDKIDKWFWGVWPEKDKNKANEVALKLRDECSCFTEVIEFEPGEEIPQHISL